MSKCLQRGQPACPVLYEEWAYLPKRIYAEVDHFYPGETMSSGMVQRIYVKDEIHLHVYLQQCLLGLDHEGGHLTDTRHGRIRWWIEEEEAVGA